MRAVNITELKKNPSAALRSAREDDLVVVMNRDQPQALLVNLTRLKLPDLAGVKLALAVALFGQGNVSLGYAARIAGKSLSGMMDMLTHMGIPIVKVSAPDVRHDLAALDAWTKRGRADGGRCGPLIALSKLGELAPRTLAVVEKCR